MTKLKVIEIDALTSKVVDKIKSIIQSKNEKIQSKVSKIVDKKLSLLRNQGLKKYYKNYENHQWGITAFLKSEYPNDFKNLDLISQPSYTLVNDIRLEIIISNINSDINSDKIISNLVDKFMNFK